MSDRFERLFGDSPARLLLRLIILSLVVGVVLPALGVQGTPTFFVDGKQLQPKTYGDLTDALDAALAK